MQNIDPNSILLDPGKAAELHALTNKTLLLSRAVDWWNSGYVWAGALALLIAFLVFFAQWQIIIKGRELSSVQTALLAAKDSAAKDDSKAKDLKIADALQQAASSNQAAGIANLKAEEARLGATRAQASLASAERQAAEANSKAEGFRLDIATANTAAAQAQAKVAQATAESEKARLETAKLKEVITWRTISQVSAESLESLLTAKPGSVNLRYTDGDPEALYLAIQVSQILARARWKIASGSEKLANGIIFGIALPDSNSGDALTLRSAFRRAGIEFTSQPLPPQRVTIMGNYFDGAPTIMIGSRSPVAP